MEKVSFMPPMEYSLNIKMHMVSMEYTPMVYSPYGKAMVL